MPDKKNRDKQKMKRKKVFVFQMGHLAVNFLSLKIRPFHIMQFDEWIGPYQINDQLIFFVNRCFFKSANRIVELFVNKGSPAWTYSFSIENIRFQAI